MNDWDRIRDSLEGELNQHSFYTWFNPTAYARHDDHVLFVRVPNRLFADWLTKHYVGRIYKTMHDMGLPLRRVEFFAEDASEPVNDNATPRAEQIEQATKTPERELSRDDVESAIRAFNAADQLLEVIRGELNGEEPIELDRLIVAFQIDVLAPAKTALELALRSETP